MRLTVHDERRLFNQQTHAYAEYRAFSRLADRADPIDEVAVMLTRGPADEAHPDGPVVCRVAVTLRSGEGAAAQAVAGHAYAAIDGAVSLVRQIPLPAPGRRRRAARTRTRETRTPLALAAPPAAGVSD